MFLTGLLSHLVCSAFRNSQRFASIVAIWSRYVNVIANDINLLLCQFRLNFVDTFVDRGTLEFALNSCTGRMSRRSGVYMLFLKQGVHRWLNAIPVAAVVKRPFATKWRWYAILVAGASHGGFAHVFSSQDCECDGTSELLLIDEHGEYVGSIVCGEIVADLLVHVVYENGTCYWRLASEALALDELFEIGSGGQSCEEPDFSANVTFNDCEGSIQVKRFDLAILEPRAAYCDENLGATVAIVFANRSVFGALMASNTSLNNSHGIRTGEPGETFYLNVTKRPAVALP